MTGGAGFIGANFVHSLIAETDVQVINLDKLTYAGNPDTLAPLRGNARHVFVAGDIGDRDLVRRLLGDYRVDAVVNFAAESHVDRSIEGPAAFIETNVVGAFNLLACAREYWAGLGGAGKEVFRFLHVSTDEVYGSLGPTGRFAETTPTRPIHPMRPPRRPRTTWCGPGIAPMACRCSPPRVPIPMVPTSFPKNSFRWRS